MKNFLILFVITTVIFSCNANRKWTAADRSKFVKDCVGAAQTMGEAQAKSYCECMQPKVEAKYPTVAEANRLTAADFQSADWTAEVRKCLGMGDTDNPNNNNGGNPIDNTSNEGNTDGSFGWTSSQRTQFITDCANAAKDGMGEEKARAYCECMQPKLEAKYGTFAQANKISQAELQSEEWLKEVRACLGYE